MTLKFQCEKCGGDIVVKCAKPGDEVLCRRCGAHVTVPETSVEVDKELGPVETDRFSAAEADEAPRGKYGAPSDGPTNHFVDNLINSLRIRVIIIAAALLVAFVLTACSTLYVPRVLATHRVLTCERKGDLFLKSIDHEGALKWYERGLEVDPERYSLHYGKAKALRGMARYEEAVVAFDRAAELEPDSWLAPYNKAEILADLGRREEAVENYGQALKFLDDDYPETRYRAYWGKIRALKRLGRTEEALETYDEALIHFPEDGFLRRSKARFLIELGRYEDPALGSLRRREAVALILDERGKEIPRIAKKYLGTAPASGSTVTVRFKVAASGAVTACSVESSTPGNAAMEREVRRHVMAWRFPPGDGEVLTFTHRSAFKRVDSD
jgi:TonB family protein